jgi:DHHC palmitoyltransferase
MKRRESLISPNDESDDDDDSRTKEEDEPVGYVYLAIMVSVSLCLWFGVWKLMSYLGYATVASVIWIICIVCGTIVAAAGSLIVCCLYVPPARYIGHLLKTRLSDAFFPVAQYIMHVYVLALLLLFVRAQIVDDGRFAWLQSLLGFVCILSAPVSYLFSFRARRDPGFLAPANCKESDNDIDDYDGGEDYADREARRVCRTCHIDRPLRSKHCAKCDRCVARLDHHCSYINQCVGPNNQRGFMLFLAVQIAQIIAAIVLLVYVVRDVRTEWDAGTYHLSVVVALLVYIVAALIFLLGNQVINSAFNITLNEQLNHRRYTYIDLTSQRFHNPFDRGIAANFWLLLTAYKDERPQWAASLAANRIDVL